MKGEGVTVTTTMIQTSDHQVDDTLFAMRLQRFVNEVVIPDIIAAAPAPGMTKVHAGQVSVGSQGQLEISVIVPKHYKYVEEGISEDVPLKPLVERNEEGRLNVLAFVSGDFRPFATLKARPAKPFIVPTIQKTVGEWMSNGLP